MDDLSRFKQTYFDESAELLAVAEAGLLRLSPGDVDMDEVNAIFRAVHSIKGGGGAFGFSDLVAFSHEFETVMDEVRNSAIPVTTELVDTLIRANDVLAQMLAYAGEGVDAPPGATDDTVAALRHALAASGGGTASAAPQTPPPAASAVNDDEDDEAGIFGDAMAAINAARDSEAPSPAPADRVRWTIVFRPKSDLLLSGNEPAYMLRALRRLGDAEIVCHLDDLPKLADLDAELLHLSWTITLTADAEVGRERIDDVFEFVADECDIQITADAPLPAVIAPPPTRDAPPNTPPALSESALVPPGATAVKTDGTAKPRGAGTNGGPGTNGGSGGGEHAGLTTHTIRVDLDKIDRLVNMVGEMVITQAMIAEHLRDVPPASFRSCRRGWSSSPSTPANCAKASCRSALSRCRASFPACPGWSGNAPR